MTEATTTLTRAALYVYVATLSVNALPALSYVKDSVPVALWACDRRLLVVAMVLV